MRISELATQAGIAPSTLRYYERIGLMPSPGRTASGYRSYGNDDVARLLFVTRAKRIGLTLEQIAELLQVWDGVNCGTTFERITGLVAEKRTEIADRITELQQFAQQLDDVSAALDEITPPATCRPDLSCCLPETNADTAIVVDLIPRPRH